MKMASTKNIRKNCQNMEVRNIGKILFYFCFFAFVGIAVIFEANADNIQDGKKIIKKAQKRNIDSFNILTNIPDGYITNKKEIEIEIRLNRNCREIKINGEKAGEGKKARKIISLKQGKNSIKIEAIDLSGQVVEKTICITANYDEDNDGLEDIEELRYGTDLRTKDTDKDGISDGEEVKKYQTNPLKWDTDGDGLTDGEEIKKYKTNPLEKDTDNDGLEDEQEIWYKGTDPLRKDTDKDGLTDGDEVKKYKTFPDKKDTDDDGLNDYEEIYKYKTDPAKKDSDDDGINDKKEIDKGTDPLKPDNETEKLENFVYIEKLKTQVKEQKCTIEFTTNIPSKAEILYGLSMDYSRIQRDDKYSREHIFELNNLRPGRIYHYFVLLYAKGKTFKGRRDRIFKTKDLNTPPTIKVDYPSDGMTSIYKELFVEGRTRIGSIVRVNGKRAEICNNKFFKSGIELVEGWNTIKIEAEDKFGKTEKELKIFYDSKPYIRITSDNIPEGVITKLPDRFRGKWEGKDAEITINGRECKVYRNGIWIGPKNIYLQDAEKLGISKDDENYLIIDPTKRVDIELKITGKNEGIIKKRFYIRRFMKKLEFNENLKKQASNRGDKNLFLDAVFNKKDINAKIYVTIPTNLIFSNSTRKLMVLFKQVESFFRDSGNIREKIKEYEFNGKKLIKRNEKGDYYFIVEIEEGEEQVIICATKIPDISEE